MINEKYIKSIDDIAELITNQKYDERVQRNRSSLLYRGIPNVEYKLQTSLQRNCKCKEIELEKSILRNFSKYAEIEDPQLKKSIWRQMIIGQHHGLPTRLLDWTYSPLIGLHFATSGEDLDNMKKHDSVLWEIDIEEINKLLPKEYQDNLNENGAYLFTIDMLAKLETDIKKYDNKMKADSMVLIEPPSIDQRIINQYSYFSIIPIDMKDIEEFLDIKTKNTVKYIIDKDLRWRIRDMLDQMNINERIVYPGLDGLSSWLKRHYYVK
ncbi:FRG domain-containing protein [Clostridium gasigenes]|uniref:FRG domain-containing protein n=1 Tax=Clostridium gasigenes TaxID=94869 RepID=UPI0014384281|nr:FRG domain-containing protein [Clostridium gasigenes]NKF07107.1 FRG domain-containing protein [Clostridium gasigenes]QSW19640.1 FRG domain-containing protein [Clostridium gasigenes]